MWNRNESNPMKPQPVFGNAERPGSQAAQPISQPVAPAPRQPEMATIGSSMVIRGEIDSAQDLYLDGQVSGALNVPNNRLTIGPNGKADAGAKAREIVVMGSINGNIEAVEKVTIKKGGRLVGDIRTAGIVIDDGAFFKGAIDIVKKVAVIVEEAAQPMVYDSALPSAS